MLQLDASLTEHLAPSAPHGTSEAATEAMMKMSMTKDLAGCSDTLFYNRAFELSSPVPCGVESEQK